MKQIEAAALDMESDPNLDGTVQQHANWAIGQSLGSGKDGI